MAKKEKAEQKASFRRRISSRLHSFLIRLEPLFSFIHKKKKVYLGLVISFVLSHLFSELRGFTPDTFADFLNNWNLARIVLILAVFYAPSGSLPIIF